MRLAKTYLPERVGVPRRRWSVLARALHYSIGIDSNAACSIAELSEDTTLQQAAGVLIPNIGSLNVSVVGRKTQLLTKSIATRRRRWSPAQWPGRYTIQWVLIAMLRAG